MLTDLLTFTTRPQSREGSVSPVPRQGNVCTGDGKKEEGAQARVWQAKQGTCWEGKGERGDWKLSHSCLKRTAGFGLGWQPPHPCQPAGRVDGGLLSLEIWHVPRPRQGDWVPSQSWARGQRFRVLCWCQLLRATLQLPLGSPTDLQNLQLGGGRASLGSRPRQGELSRVTLAAWEVPDQGKDIDPLPGSSPARREPRRLTRQSHLVATVLPTQPEALRLEIPPHLSWTRTFPSSPRVSLPNQNSAVDKKVSCGFWEEVVPPCSQGDRGKCCPPWGG